MFMYKITMKSGKDLLLSEDLGNRLMEDLSKGGYSGKFIFADKEGVTYLFIALDDISVAVNQSLE